MKLIRYGKVGLEKPGLQLNETTRIDVSHIIDDYDEAFFSDDSNIEKLKTWAEANKDSAPLISNDIRLGPPIKRPSKIICIGLNYMDHAKEANMEAPNEPMFFMKSTSSLCGPNDSLILPKNSKKVDWEVELAIVIGKKALYVSEDEAESHIAGYVLHNDYSERAFQLERVGQWTKGKSCDSFGPLGPWISTKDEIQDPHNLNLWCKVNGEVKQKSSTSNLIFKLPSIVSYVSQFMSLLPGDIISTGTPAGVGLGFNPPQFIKADDKIEIGVDGLGQSSQKAEFYQA